MKLNLQLQKKKRIRVSWFSMLWKMVKKIDELLVSRESSNHPPSLTTPTGDMFHGTNADLMHCILEHVQIQKKAPDSQTEIVVDLSFLMQSFKPGTSTTIGEFIHVIIITYVRAHLQKYKIVDLVCDVYLGKSLKAALRDIRCQGERKGVRLYTKMPRNFQSFLWNKWNKIELNQLIACEVSQMDCPEDSLIVKPGKDMYISVQPCNPLTWFHHLIMKRRTHVPYYMLLIWNTRAWIPSFSWLMTQISSVLPYFHKHI